MWLAHSGHTHFRPETEIRVVLSLFAIRCHQFINLFRKSPWTKQLCSQAGCCCCGYVRKSEPLNGRRWRNQSNASQINTHIILCSTCSCHALFDKLNDWWARWPLRKTWGENNGWMFHNIIKASQKVVPVTLKPRINTNMSLLTHSDMVIKKNDINSKTFFHTILFSTFHASGKTDLPHFIFFMFELLVWQPAHEKVYCKWMNKKKKEIISVKRVKKKRILNLFTFICS